MKKALIIGVMGFAGSALRTELESKGYDVYGADIVSDGDRVAIVDMLDKQAVDALFKEVRPDYIFNLAGQASPIMSWKDINLTMHLNVDLSVNIAEAAAEHCPDARILFIGSANQYDMSRASTDLIDEDTPLIDNSPYSVSKNAQEALLKLIAEKRNLDFIFTRSFNHIGPKQKEGFVVTDYSMRIAKLERGDIDTFEYGNLDSWRDFSDVRDIVRAYRLLAEKGKSGEIYNVGSGRSYYIRDMIGILVNASEKAKTQTSLPPRLADDQLIHYKGDISKLQKDTGFESICNIEETLINVLEAYREKYA